jgi:hypothetical protein
MLALSLLLALTTSQQPASQRLRQPNSTDATCSVLNLLSNSKAFDNAAWLKEQAVSAAPVVTANAGTAPDGTATADRVQFGDSTGTNYSDTYQLLAGAGATSCAVYVKGFSGAGTVDLSMQTGASTWTATPCAFVSASWTLCKYENASRFSNGGFFIGNSGYANGGAARTGTDVLLWGAQCVTGATAATCVATGPLTDALEMLAGAPRLQPWRVR